MIGLGRMGANMLRRLVKHGHTVVGNARHRESVDPVVADGMIGAYSLEELTDKLRTPRAVWFMVPAASVESTIESLAPLLARDDIIIDGGNSYYHDDIRRAQALTSAGIDYVDDSTRFLPRSRPAAGRYRGPRAVRICAGPPSMATSTADRVAQAIS
jgi:6-phosphogluconate dehydrogenase